MIDVAQLLEDSETKTDALERVAELEDDLSQVTERLTEVEEEAMTKTGTLSELSYHFLSSHFMVV